MWTGIYQKGIDFGRWGDHDEIVSILNMALMGSLWIMEFLSNRHFVTGSKLIEGAVFGGGADDHGEMFGLLLNCLKGFSRRIGKGFGSSSIHL